MTKTVPAVDRALRILNTFKDGQTEYGVSELSQRLGINKSTAHNILHTLAEHRFLERNPATRRYRLGPGLIELGYLARAHRDVLQLARSALHDLMHTTGQTVLLGVFENDGITIIDKAEPAGEMKVTATIGQRLPFCAGCFGRAFLAWMPEAEVDRLLASPGLQAFTETSITDPAACKAQLALTRAQGYAVDDTEEYLKGVWGVSAPIRGLEGVVAAITVLGFTSQMSAEEKQACIQAAHRTAQALSIGNENVHPARKHK